MGIGKMPLLYAARRVPGSRSAPMPRKPSSVAVEGSGKPHRDAGGSSGTVVSFVSRPAAVPTGYLVVATPPSTGMMVPVRKLPARDDRKMAVPAMSSGRPMRFNGIILAM